MQALELTKLVTADYGQAGLIRALVLKAGLVGVGLVEKGSQSQRISMTTPPCLQVPLPGRANLGSWGENSRVRGKGPRGTRPPGLKTEQPCPGGSG